MNSGRAFCPVCTEQLINRMMRFADPVDTIRIQNGEAQAQGPIPGVVVEWSRDGAVFETTGLEEPVTVGHRPFEVRATLRTPQVRSDRYGDGVYEATFDPGR
jgi:hypothetical protein